MNSADVMDIAREGIWVMIKIGGPLLMAALIVGLIISFVQALTQIQEMTLSFVPKILVLFLILVLIMPFMGRVMMSFSDSLFNRIVAPSQNMQKA